MTRSSMITIYPPEQYQDLTTDEIEQLVEEEFNTSIQNEKGRAFKDMLRGVLLVIIAIPLFTFHWKKAQTIWCRDSDIEDTD